MIDRLRVLLDRPLEARVAGAVIAMAASVTVGFAIVVGLGGVGSSDAGHRSTTAGIRPSAPPHLKEVAPRDPSVAAPPAPPSAPRRQDPQDRRGTSAFRQAEREARQHRALQHVPYRKGRLRIELRGARHGLAILRVSAPTRRAAKRGWRTFLRRFRDSGRAYRPTFVATGGTR